MIQIQFLDKNVPNALVPVYTMKPERVIYMYDTRVINDFAKREIEEAVTHRLPGTKVEFVRVNMLRMEDIRYDLERLVKTYGSKEQKKEKLQIDVTGGNAIMTSAGVLVAEEYGIEVTYADFHSGYMLQMFTAQRLKEVEHVRLEDYLRAIGGKLLSGSRHTPREEDFRRIEDMAEVVFANEKKWDKFFAHMTRGYSAKGVNNFSMNEKAGDKDCRFMLEEFLKRGFAKKVGEDRYVFASDADKEYMTVSGIWLEMYIYIQAKRCFEDVYIGVDIDWNKRDICHSRDNEIDVVIMRQSQPVFISCKMRQVEKENVYEIYSMAKRLSGDAGRSMIATTDRVSNGKDHMQSIYMRMEKMKVGLIELNDFKRYQPQDVFSAALRMTE